MRADTAEGCVSMRDREHRLNAVGDLLPATDTYTYTDADTATRARTLIRQTETRSLTERRTERKRQKNT